MAAGKSMKYPQIRKDEGVKDVYFGKQIPDTYRWLELNSEEVKKFVEVQNKLTDEYLRKTTPPTAHSGGNDNAGGVDGCQIRERIRSRLVDLCSYCDYGCPFKRGDHNYFYFKDGALYKFESVENTFDNCEQVETIVLDPSDAADGFLNDTSSTPKGTFVGLSVSTKEKTDENFGDGLVSISNDGNVLAYGISENGSVWSTVCFKNLETGVKYNKDILKNVRQDTYLSWTQEGDGLFYGSYPMKTINYKNQKIFFHRLDTPQSQDKLILEFTQNPEWELKPKVSDCGEYLIVYVLQDCGGHTKVYLGQMQDIRIHIDSKEKSKTLPPFIPLVDDFKWDFDYITNQGPIFYFVTNKHAPNSKVVKVNITLKKQIEKKSWPAVVKQHRRRVLDWAVCVNNNYLITCYIKKAWNILQLRRLKSGSLLYQFPLDMGSVTQHTGRVTDTNFFFKFSSFLSPGTIYQVDLQAFESEMKEARKQKFLISCCSCFLYSNDEYYVPLKTFKECTPLGFDPNKYEVNQVSYSSQDGIKVSMFLVHKKKIVKNGNNPAMLVSYGGFNTSLQPNFDPTYLLFMEHFNGVYAVANIRGGGEYGRRWYEAGIRLKKQNSLNDFQFAARYLIRAKYTCPDLLTIRGNSNGGLVVAANINQKPELYGVAIIGFGVLDLLRFHKFSSGSCWISDYGSPVNEKDFNNLLSISPLHNVKVPEKTGVQYPATLIITAANDEIVLPLHSYKMIAQLQSTIGSLPQQKNPLLLRVTRNAGHGDGQMSFDTAIDETTDIMTFIAISLNLRSNEK